MSYRLYVPKYVLGCVFAYGTQLFLSTLILLLSASLATPGKQPAARQRARLWVEQTFLPSVLVRLRLVNVRPSFIPLKVAAS